jgi:hypothetical protein
MVPDKTLRAVHDIFVEPEPIKRYVTQLPVVCALEFLKQHRQLIEMIDRAYFGTVGIMDDKGRGPVFDGDLPVAIRILPVHQAPQILRDRDSFGTQHRCSGDEPRQQFQEDPTPTANAPFNMHWFRECENDDQLKDLRATAPEFSTDSIAQPGD